MRNASLALWLLALTCLGVGYLIHQFHGMEKHLSAPPLQIETTSKGIKLMEMPPSSITLVYSYCSTSCGTVTISTTCGIGYDGEPIEETREECKTRHLAEIAAWKKLCPNDCS